MDYVGYFLIGLVAILFIAVFLGKSIKLIIKITINGVLGAIVLLLVNIVGARFNVHIGINAITALVVGFLGIPGVIFLIVFKYLL